MKLTRFPQAGARTTYLPERLQITNFLSFSFAKRKLVTYIVGVSEDAESRKSKDRRREQDAAATHRLVSKDVY